jgi:hypothetical protein
MPSLIADLPKSSREALLADLNYLNMAEIKSFCKRHAIPYSIWIETRQGAIRKTHEDDRKGIILNRICHFLTTGRVLAATCFPAGVVCLDAPPANRNATDKLFYGQYDKRSKTMINLLKKLTRGRFENGAIARILAREFWSRGHAPTYAEFAAAWIKAKEGHTRPNREWAFLTDRANRNETVNWRQLRLKKAMQVLKILNRLEPQSEHTKHGSA